MPIHVPYNFRGGRKFWQLPDGDETDDPQTALEAHRAASGGLHGRGAMKRQLRQSRGGGGGFSPSLSATPKAGGAAWGGVPSGSIQDQAIEMREPFGGLGGLQNRNTLAGIKTPIGCLPQVHLAAGQLTVTTAVQRTIPAGSTLWIAGMAPGSTLDAVVVDGQGLFLQSPIATQFVDPVNNMATGYFIERAITQAIAITTTVPGAITVNPVLMIRSIEALQAQGFFTRCA